MSQAVTKSKKFQSTLPTRGSDPKGSFFYQYFVISIHAPHEGERPSALYTLLPCGRFQSTLPTRGSDTNDTNRIVAHRYFNPRSPRGGATCGTHAANPRALHFNPRSPRGGATLVTILNHRRINISIHAPHEGERPHAVKLHVGAAYISIHAPHEGERHYFALSACLARLFQSTLPTRGSDPLRCIPCCLAADFNPRSPRGGATTHTAKLIPPKMISIHAPHEGERRRKSAFVCSISANLLNIIHCGTVTRAVSRRRIALFRLFSVRRSDVFMYAYASH